MDWYFNAHRAWYNSMMDFWQGHPLVFVMVFVAISWFTRRM